MIKRCSGYTALQPAKNAMHFAGTCFYLAERLGSSGADVRAALCYPGRLPTVGNPIISSDAMIAYRDAIRSAFGVHVHYGQIEKRYVGEPPIDAARRYSPGVVVGVHREGVFGSPPRFLIGTSHVERANLKWRFRLSSRALRAARVPM